MQGQEYNPDDIKPENMPKIGRDGNVVGMVTPDQYMAQHGDQPLEVQPQVSAPVVQTPVVEGQPAVAPVQPVQPAQVPQATPDTDITVGGVTKKQSEWLAEMENAYNVDTSQIPAENRLKMLQGYIKDAHDAAWKRSNTQKAEENSRQRREVEAAAREIQMRQRVLADTEQRINAEKERLQSTATRQMAENQIYREDGTLDPQKLFEFNQIQMAKQRLVEIESEQVRLQSDLQKIAIDRTIAEAEELMASHPEIAMTEPLQAVIEKVDRQGQREHPDVQKLLDVYDIVDYAKKMNITLEMAFQRKAATGGLLSVRGNTPTAVPNIQITVPSTPSAERIAANVSGKQDGAQFLDGKGSLPTRPQVIPKQSLGDRVRDASQRSSAGRGNPALDKLGF